MARPKPVPPYLRDVPASACWNASKMSRCFSGATPMPVSSTVNATTCCALVSTAWSGLQPRVAMPTLTCTCPCDVNLTAFESRFLRICCSRFGSLTIDRGRSGARRTLNGRFFASATCRKLRSIVSRRPANVMSSTSTVTVPDSIFDRSRMSLIRCSRSDPDELMLRENSTCLPDRLPAEFSASCWLRIRMEFSGVRSSCDMFARNSDLYFDVRASSAACSSSARRACSTSAFLRSTSAFCSASRRALVPSSSLVFCSSLCRDCSSTVSCCDCVSRPSVRMVASIVLKTAPMLCVSRSRNASEPALKFCSDASSMTALVSPSNRTGSTTTLTRCARPRLDSILTKSAGTSVSRMRFFSAAHWPTRPSPIRIDAARSTPCA